MIINEADSINKRHVIQEQRGFTMMELLVVVAILAMLAALIGPRVMGYLGESKVKTTRIQIEQLGTALDAFRLDNGRFPTTPEGLHSLIEKPEGLSSWNGPYLKKRQVPMDAWNHEFLYQKPSVQGGVEYDLYSLGADNKPGGEGQNADIGNW